MKAATFHKTTSAKKISTNEFRHGAELEELLGGGGGGGGGAARSLKYESIVTLAQQQQTNQNTASGHVTQYSSLIGQQQQQSPGENTSPGSELPHHPAPDKLVGTPLQPSPYVYRHRQVG